MHDFEIHRLSAFTSEPEGGNPAGVVLASQELPDARMQSVAKDVGYSETAFLWPSGSQNTWHARYFSPVAEVPFCGHATIASGAALAQRFGDGTHQLLTRPGPVSVDVSREGDLGRASLTSVPPATRALPPGLLADCLAAFGWGEQHLAPSLRPALAFGGAWHLLVPVRSRLLLAEMVYDFDAMLALMLANDLTTIDVLWRESSSVWHARNPFPVGGVVEDPATGAAAAAFGGWLRETGQVTPPADVVVHQGQDMGRPSRLEVTIPESGGIIVAGTAVPIR